MTAAIPAHEIRPNPELHIVATIAPMYCFAKNIVGDLAYVRLIVPPGTSPNGFKPSPDDIQKILHADIIIENGFGFEPWIDHLVAQGLPSNAERVIASRGTGPGIPGLPGDPNTPPADSSTDPTLPPDPHVWLDPLMAIKELQNIRDVLMTRDPSHANQYLANENRYEAALRDLDDEIGRTTVDITRRRLLCIGPAFTYFLSRYEFPIAATIASPADAAAAATTHPADAILAPPGTILNRTGLSIVIADPMETGTASTDFYEEGTRANAAAFRKALLP
jgi:ABC-type Zn uptake system ZnuABC Zn-binding protein ZnuA